MFVEIVFTGLPIDRDEVQEALEDTLGAGGEITGAGSGKGPCHLHLEIQASLDPGLALDRLRTVLAEPGVEGIRDLQRQGLIRRLDEAIPAK